MTQTAADKAVKTDPKACFDPACPKMKELCKALLRDGFSTVRLLKNPLGEEPRRVPSSADDGRKGNSVISGDMRVGNDTSHDGQGDFSARIEPCPSCIPLSKKAKGLFRQTAGTALRRPRRLSYSDLVALSSRVSVVFSQSSSAGTPMGSTPMGAAWPKFKL